MPVHNLHHQTILYLVIQSILSVIVFRFLVGSPLSLLESQCSHYASLIEEHGGLIFGLSIRISWQAALTLMGHAKNTTSLRGEALSESCELEGNFLDSLFQHHRCMLYTYLGCHEEGAALAITLGDSLSELLPGHPLFPANVFYRGVSLFAMARQTKARQWIKHAERARATIKRFIHLGNPNVHHYDVLLDAEHAALQKNFRLAERFYQSAMVDASQVGFAHDSALATERYGDFLLRDMNDKKQAGMRLQEASRLYTEWGAVGAAEGIQSRHADLLS